YRGHRLRQCRPIVGGVGGRVAAYLRPSLPRPCSNRFSRWSSRSTSLAWSESDYMPPPAVGWDLEMLWGGRRGNGTIVAGSNMECPDAPAERLEQVPRRPGPR